MQTIQDSLKNADDSELTGVFKDLVNALEKQDKKERKVKYKCHANFFRDKQGMQILPSVYIGWYEGYGWIDVSFLAWGFNINIFDPEGVEQDYKYEGL